MQIDYGYVEEDYRGKPYDRRLLKRLLPLLRPYRRALIGSIALVGVLTLLGLALPYFSKIAIDRYIVPSQGAQQSSGAHTLAVNLADPAVRSVVDRHPQLFRISDGQAIIALNELNQLPKSELRQLRHRDIAGLGWVALIFLALVGVDFWLTFLQRVIMERVGHMMMHDIRMRLFDHIQQQSIAFFSRQPVARLVTRMTNDVQNMHELFTTFVSVVFKDLFLLLGIAIVLLVLDYRLALAAFAVLPLVVVAAVGFSVRARDIFRALRVKVAQINGRMAETIEGIKSIQTFVQEKKNYERFERLNAENYRLGMQEIHVFAFFMPMIEALGIIAVGIVIFYGGFQVMGGRISLGVLVVGLSYVRMFFRPMRELAENYNILQNAMSSAERIFGLLDIDNRLPQSIKAPKGASIQTSELRTLEVDDVSFAYVPGEWILRHVSFKVDRGQTLALVGPTGAGKTSLLNLIQRFYDPAAGQVRFNGKDLRAWDIGQLRSMIALVTQEPVLFSTTVRRNIFPDPDAVDDETAARIVAAANCEALVKRLPQGLDTPLEKGGAGLSSGERQLITIARALARDARLILLDEATSYIDSQTEHAVHQALRNLTAGRTTIIVAHRLSTARMADRIVVLHQSSVAEIGTHDQLMRRKGLYWQLHQHSNDDVTGQAAGRQVPGSK